MKKAVLFSAIGMLATAGSVVAAEEVGRVISSTPVIQQVAVPRQVCSNQPMAVQQPNSGGGAVLGAIAGGALGNQIGHGSGRAAATLIGLIGGAAVGNNIEGQGSYVQNVQHCTTQTYYENRTVGYNVTYEYAGKQHSVQLPYDPGATIRLELTPLAGTTPPPADAPTVASTSSGPPGTPVGVIIGTPTVQPLMAAPTVVTYPSYYPGYYPAYPAYPAYYARPYYPPIGLSLNLGYSRGHRHHHHHHRR
jgi:uncharacterized protein YcfJ